MNDYEPPPPPLDPDVSGRPHAQGDHVVREWALGVAARHRDRHWCLGMDAIMGPGYRMFGGRVIKVDCDARNAALSLIGRIEPPCEHGNVGFCGSCEALIERGVLG